MRVVESSSSLLVVVVVVVVDGLFKPKDECFRCAFGLRTTRTVDEALEFFRYSKAN